MASDKEINATVTREKTVEHTYDVEPLEQPDVSTTAPQSVTPTSTSTEHLGATGYNPNLKPSHDTGSESVRKPILDARQNGVPNGPTQPEQSRKIHDEAPDLGKDYGDSQDPGYNGYQKDGKTPEGARPSKEVPEREGYPNTGVPNQSGQPENPQSDLSKDGDGLQKKDDLNKEDKQKKEESDQKEEKRPRESGQSEGASASQKEQPKDEKRPEDEGKKKSKEEESPENLTQKNPPQQQEGNGYGALNKPNKGESSTQDGTAMARRNLEHAKRMQQGEQAGNGAGGNAGKSDNPFFRKRDNDGINSDSNKGSLGARIKNGLGKLGKNRTKDSISEGGKGGKSTSKSFTDNIRQLATFVATHPYATIVIVSIALIFLILIICCIDDEFNGGSGKGTHCTYDLKGVVSTGSVKLEGLQVELINCGGTASNYTVLETVDFEKYVLGVALAEIGPGAPDEAFKSQIIAARGFSLSRNSGMCPGNQDGCFYGYNASTGKIRMRACEADQVYWDYEKNIYRQARGSISLYSPEVTSGTLWKAALSPEDIARYQALADDVKGKVLVDSNGNVVSTNYINTTSQQFISKANEGKNYEQILAEVYTDSDGFSSGQCTSYGNIDYGDYVLSSQGHTILHQPIDQFLRSKGSSLEEFNGLIESNVEKAGYGTRAGVVAAAVTLIGELGNNYGVKVPYYWGGGHFDGVVIGALDTWGTTKCHTYANNTSYNYCGLDCSGFVSWAIKNGGFNIGPSNNFARNLSGVRKVNLSNKAVMQPGDLLESSGHVILIIGIEESSGSYICAEASGNSEGVLFTRRPFNSSGYWGVDMEGFYQNNVRSK